MFLLSELAYPLVRPKKTADAEPEKIMIVG